MFVEYRNSFSLRELCQLCATTQMPRLSGQLERVTNRLMSALASCISTLDWYSTWTCHGKGELIQWQLMAGQIFLHCRKSSSKHLENAKSSFPQVWNTLVFTAIDIPSHTVCLKHKKCLTQFKLGLQLTIILIID